MGIGAWGNFADRITGWVDKWFKRKEGRDEKNAAKDVMSGNERGVRGLLNRLYKKRNK